MLVFLDTARQYCWIEIEKLSLMELQTSYSREASPFSGLGFCVAGHFSVWRLATVSPSNKYQPDLLLIFNSFQVRLNHLRTMMLFLPPNVLFYKRELFSAKPQNTIPLLPAKTRWQIGIGCIDLER